MPTSRYRRNVSMYGSCQNSRTCEIPSFSFQLFPYPSLCLVFPSTYQYQPSAFDELKTGDCSERGRCEVVPVCYSLFLLLSSIFFYSPFYLHPPTSYISHSVPRRQSASKGMATIESLRSRKQAIAIQYNENAQFVRDLQDEAISTLIPTLQEELDLDEEAVSAATQILKDRGEF